MARTGGGRREYQNAAKSLLFSWLSAKRIVRLLQGFVRKKMSYSVRATTQSASRPSGPLTT